MEINEIKKGMIVVVTDEGYSGNLENSIVKVLSRPGETSDETMKHTNSTKHKLLHNTVLCEAIRFHMKRSLHCNNKPAFYQLITELRPANIDEKKAYTKGIRHINNVKYIAHTSQQNI